MRLFTNMFRLSLVLFTLVVLSMCTTDEGFKPSDNAQISGRGLTPGGGGSTSVNLIGLSLNNELVFMTAFHSVTETGVVPIGGLRTGESMRAIDMNKKTGILYGLSTESVIYKIDINTGSLHPVGPAFKPAASGDLIGFDVDPNLSLIRVMTSSLQNLKISMTTGQVIGQDLSFHIPGVAINGIAYGPISTLGGGGTGGGGTGGGTGGTGGGGTGGSSGNKAPLYAINLGNQSLYKQTPSGTGTPVLVGSTGWEWTAEGGFDIGPNNVGYTVQYGIGLHPLGTFDENDLTTEEYRLYSINLSNAITSSYGTVRPLMGLTVK